MEIRYHIMRSTLSLLGIVLGVMNLSAMFSVINGAKNMNENMMNSLGTPDQIQISLDNRKRRKAVEKKNLSLGWQDVENIKKYASTIKAVGVEVFARYTLQYKNVNEEYTVIGLLPATFDMNKYEVSQGREFNESDMIQKNKICVIGTDVKNKFFPNTDPIGKLVRVQNEYFRVVGVLKEFNPFKKGEQGDRDNPLEWKNKRLLIPVTTMQSRFLGSGDTRNWFAVFVQARSVELVPDCMDEIRNILLKTHDNQDVFEIKSIQERSKEQENFNHVWEIVLGLVAGISLLVGGVGIMNVMLASFRERVREIGIRKALGATHADIFLLFIVETMLICIIGGVLGLIAGYFISTGMLNAMLAQSNMPSSPSFSFSAGLVAVFFSMIVGVLAGIYPAIKAARLEPVEALRYE